MPQPARDPVAFHGGSDALAHNQTDARRTDFVTVRSSTQVHDDIGLCHTNPVLHRRVKVN
ncbi:hypothetical protein MYCO108962_25630 [Mycobacterium colombiense]